MLIMLYAANSILCADVFVCYQLGIAHYMVNAEYLVYHQFRFAYRIVHADDRLAK